MTDWLLQSIELAAVISAAAFGILLATRMQMDFVGQFSVACAVSFGGGTLRDLFLDRYPLFWVKHYEYPILVFGLALIGAIIPGVIHRLERYMAVPDALGLGMFTIVGVYAAIESGTHPFICILIGTITGTAGGVLAEIICNQVPSLFRPAPLCATCSFVGGALCVGLDQLGQPETIAASVGGTFVVLLRLAAVRWNLQLPSANHD